MRQKGRFTAGGPIKPLYNLPQLAALTWRPGRGAVAGSWKNGGVSTWKDGDPVPNAYKAFLWFREIEAQLSQVENLSIVFDGSPIDEEEAKLILDSLYPIDRKLFVIELVLPESQIKKRFTKARRSNRIDANWPIIKKRLDVYDKQTKYGALIALKTLGIVVEEVDCSDKKEDQVFEQIIRSIDYAIRKG